MDAIETYFKTLLAPRLRAYGLNKYQRENICSDVRSRLASLLLHWSDESFRRTALTLGAEEATFWEPSDASLEVRSLVVIGVRNSLIETLNAASGRQKQVLSDADMPQLTREAISYFRTVDLAHVVVTPDKDLFGDLPRRFPNAWQCLTVLAHATDNEAKYVSAKKTAELPKIVQPRAAHRLAQVVIASGIDSCVDPVLSNILVAIQKGELQAFIAPSFSRITRNPAKLLAILDHIIRHEAALVTANYALSATCVARRNPLIRPAHTSREAEAGLLNLAGLSDWHRQLLGAARNEVNLSPAK
jgi:hypothetical protein